MPRDLLPIGSFASRCRLSVKALRHYDELGLLRPAHVDVATQYRYYDRRQAPAAIAIALLRSLDVPLPAIRDVLASEDPEAVTRILDRERERRARDIARAETALRSIERLIRAGTALARTLLDRLDRLGRTLIGPVICLLPPASDETVILQMCTPIADPPPGERVMTLPAGSVAVARHVGPYEEMGLAEHALHAWAEEGGFEPNGPIRELYLSDPARVAPEALETEVLLPITRPSARTPGTAAVRR